MRIALVTDSTSDISKDLVEKYGVHIVPLTVFFGNDSYVDGNLFDGMSFYEKLQSTDIVPKTSQPSPADFQELYEKLLKEYDHVVSIHIGSKLSGTYASASMAAEFLKSDKISVFDSKSATSILEVIIIEVAEAIKRNESLDEILNIVNWSIENVKNVIAVNTLFYLQKNGRIGKASALLGGMLNFKPILMLKDGVIHAEEKVRGAAKVAPKVMEILDSMIPDTSAKVRLIVAHGDDQETADMYVTMLKEKYPNSEVFTTLCGAVIGCHAGPKVIAVGLLPSYKAV